MDEQSFDDLSKLAARASRRRAMQAIGAGAAGWALGVLGIRQTAAQTQSTPDCCPPESPNLCDLHCVDLNSDDDNCGACGTRCRGKTSCQDGDCVEAGGGGRCPEGTTKCRGDCVELASDRANCGACGVACPEGTDCAGGQCVEPGGCFSDSECGSCGACVGGQCQPVSDGRVCRESIGICDVAETCDGVSLDCPPDQFASGSTRCRASRDAECDFAEHCTGSSAMCPDDAYVPNGTACSGGMCQDGVCIPAGECEPGQQEQCGVSDVGICQFGTRVCLDNGTWGPCQGAVYPQPEICDGLDNDCDGFADNGFNFQVDPQNCGGCGIECTGGACVNGICVPTCGDGFCAESIGETCAMCPADCCPEELCGDGFCNENIGETCETCPYDCCRETLCGNGICEPGFGETCETCPEDCGTC